MNFSELETLTYDTLPSDSETVGVAKNKGIHYRTAKLVASDTTGAERNYRVRVSHLGTRTIEDLGKTREQLQREINAAYEALQPHTKAVLDSLGFEFKYLGNKTVIGQAIEGDVKNLSLQVALTNAGVRERFQELFPGVNSIPAAVTSLREYAKNFKPCTHNTMVENKDDPKHVWKCADCGYVYS